ncbi:MAG TPA: hypothetical protein VMM18_07640 [Gemmatimonadaceae bacterium]|nr:hypothetical protein [Gemmatimonadaceae bacterium]
MRNFVVLAALVVAAGTAGAQTPAHDNSSKLQSVLPAEVASRVLARIADARARALPAQALEHRALELVAKGATPDEVARKVDGYAIAMERAKSALERGAGRAPSDDEIAAGGDVISQGVDGAAVSYLAASAASGRSLDVPMYVLSELMYRGVPAYDAVAKVQKRLAARASDAEMRADVEALPAVATERRPEGAGRPAGVGRPDFAGIPAGVPANPGVDARPTPPTPPTPPVSGPPLEF